MFERVEAGFDASCCQKLEEVNDPSRTEHSGVNELVGLHAIEHLADDRVGVPATRHIVQEIRLIGHKTVEVLRSRGPRERGAAPGARHPSVVLGRRTRSSSKKQTASASMRSALSEVWPLRTPFVHTGVSTSQLSCRTHPLWLGLIADNKRPDRRAERAAPADPRRARRVHAAEVTRALQPRRQAPRSGADAVKPCWLTWARAAIPFAIGRTLLRQS
jgi:hypothetical protein